MQNRMPSNSAKGIGKRELLIVAVATALLGLVANHLFKRTQDESVVAERVKAQLGYIAEQSTAKQPGGEIPDGDLTPQIDLKAPVLTRYPDFVMKSVGALVKENGVLRNEFGGTVRVRGEHGVVVIDYTKIPEKVCKDTTLSTATRVPYALQCGGKYVLVKPVGF